MAEDWHVPDRWRNRLIAFAERPPSRRLGWVALLFPTVVLGVWVSESPSLRRGAGAAVILAVVIAYFVWEQRVERRQRAALRQKLASIQAAGLGHSIPKRTIVLVGALALAVAAAMAWAAWYGYTTAITDVSRSSLG
jgi:hypothetical protein